MKLIYLEVTNFRNLTHVIIEPCHRINVFCGNNGSGKTSLLEAIYHLGLGRSFRTRHVSRIINHNKESFSVFSRLFQTEKGITTIGMQKDKNSQYSIKLSGKPISSLVELATYLPLQFINADNHLLLTSGPIVRRQFLDWGVFHMNPSFYSYWHRMSRTVRQRNAHLKMANSYNEIKLWDAELSTCADKLHEYRSTYIQQFSPLFSEMIEILLNRADITLDYSCGWNAQKNYSAILESSFQRDRSLGYTQFGPHRADLQLKVNNIPATDTLSQGQQKLATYALRLAQGKLLQIQTGKSCLFLIDDLPSELDPYKRALIAQILTTFDSQIFVTGVEQEGLEDLLKCSDTKMFHVEHGVIY